MKRNPAFTPKHPEYGPELVEQTGLFDDDLFAISKAKPKRTRTITCLCCERTVQLCDDCLAHRKEREIDLREQLATIAATKRRLRGELVQSLAKLSRSDDKRWSSLLQARARGEHADRIAAIAQDTTDPLSGLLRRLERYEACKQYLADRGERINRALAVFSASTEIPTKS